MAGRIRVFAWEKTPLGPIAGWPKGLKTLAGFILASGIPNVILWGPGLIQIYNDGFRQLMGNKHPAGLGQPTQECWPEAWSISEPIYRRVRAGETVSFEDKHFSLSRNGALEDGWFTASYAPIEDEAGSAGGMLVTVFETTKQHLAERALRESEERERAKRHELETILSAIPAAVFIAEDKACARMSANLAALRMLRLPEGASASKSAPGPEAPANFEIFSADGKLLKPEELPVQLAAAAGHAVEAAELELRFTEGDRKHMFGNALPLFSSLGEVRGAVGAFLDITDRKRAEEALRESEERYKGLVEQTADGIFLATPEGRFADVNPAGCEMLGMTREEVLASTFHDVLDPADHPRLPAQLEMLADGQVQLSEWRIRRKDGTVFPGEVSGRRLPNGYYQGVLRDITRRNKAEERTQLLLREVNHRSKNMLSLVLAIARQTVASNHEDFLDRFSDRIQALAAGQDLLVKSQWSGVQLHDLVRSQLAHFEDLYGGRIAVIGPPLLVSVSAAQPIGMTLHELATNAGSMARFPMTADALRSHGASACQRAERQPLSCPGASGMARQLRLRQGKASAPTLFPK